MKRVLILGAGLLARPVAGFFHDGGDCSVVVASRSPVSAGLIVDGLRSCRAERADASNRADLEGWIEASDVVIGLLPSSLHANVADLCIRHRKPLVVPAAACEDLLQRDEEARMAGVPILCETGLDPGIYHMSAIRLIDGIRRRGGRIDSLHSYCGKLPAPEANTNPFGCKIARLPEEILCSDNSPISYIEDGETKHIRRTLQFNRYRFIDIEKVGTLEAYPVGDASSYRAACGLEGCRTLGHWRLANISTCSTCRQIEDMGLLSDERMDLRGLSYSDFMLRLAGSLPDKTPQEVLRIKLGLGEWALILRKLDWLGMFDDTPVPHEEASPLEILSGRMLEKMKYQAGERDMVILHHECTAEFQDRKERITCTMVNHGIPGGESAMARTAGLPAAVSAKLAMEGKIIAAGVVTPTRTMICKPILDELAGLGITWRQSTSVVRDEPTIFRTADGSQGMEAGKLTVKG
jgi:saccharopine dehydrogenase (NADP+, L-glutamate forming)